MTNNNASKYCFAIILVLAFQFQTPAQTILQIPVTFYDFHADGSNPDFEPGLSTCGTLNCLKNLDGLYVNEVQSTLDIQGKPISGSSPHFSQRVGKWFIPWQPGDLSIPIYSTDGTYLRDTITKTDTAYKNITIQDSLPFSLVSGTAGVYQFNNSSFFRLDGKGFGNEPSGISSPHNYSFTMQIHREFTYQAGLIFQIQGDDDIWIFVNGTMVIDLGGFHGPLSALVNLDNLQGLIVGQKYKFDLFYAERHVTGSDISITTNLFTPPNTKNLNGVFRKSSTIAEPNKIKYTSEYYNLRGQKLQAVELRKSNELVFERIVGPKGLICIKRILHNAE